MSTFNLFKKDRFSIFLYLLLAFHTVSFVVFQLLNKAYERWDSAGHLGMSFWIADRFKALLSGNLNLIEFLQTSNYYPPFFQTIGAILALVVGYNSKILLYLSLVFFLLAIYFVYALVKELSKSSRLAFLSAFTFSFIPQIFEQSRFYHLDIPLVALSLAAILFFYKSDLFTNKKNSIIFFILFGFVQLTKWYGFIYILPMIFFIGIEKYNKKIGYKNLIFGIAIFLLISLPWYIVNVQSLFAQAKLFSAPEIDDPTKFLDIDTLMYYPRRIISHQLFLIPTALFLYGYIRLFKTKKKYFTWATIYLAMSYVLFTYIENKNLRYILPLTPLFAVYIANIIRTGFDKSKLTKILSYVFMSYLIITFVFLSFNQQIPQKSYQKIYGAIFSGIDYDVWYYNPTLYSYKSQDWLQNDILDFIANDGGLVEVYGVTPLIDKENFSLASLELARREKSYNNMFLPVPYFQFEPFKSDSEIVNYLNSNSVTYVVVPEDPGPKGLRNHAVLEQMIDYFRSGRGKAYGFIKEFELPDGSSMRIYKKGVANQIEEKPEAQSSKEFCIPNAGLGDGIETIQLQENHTYVFYTGHFAIYDFIDEKMEEGILKVLRIENIPHTSLLEVHSLPIGGAGMCVYPRLNVNIDESIIKPLTQPEHCGVDCNKVVVVDWKVGDSDFRRSEYTKDNLPGESGGIVPLN